MTRLKQAPTIGLLLSGTGAQLRTAGTVAEVTSGACGQITTPQKLKNVIVLRGWKPHAEATLENRCPLTVTGLLMLPVLATAVVRLIIDPRLHSNPDGAEIPFDNILDRVTGSDPSVTDYILESPAKCPNCRREILEKTLIEPA